LQVAGNAIEGLNKLVLSTVNLQTFNVLALNPSTKTKPQTPCRGFTSYLGRHITSMNVGDTGDTEHIDLGRILSHLHLLSLAQA
jgi:hypothetical protein